MTKSNKICYFCGNYNENGHELTMSKQPKCQDCWKLSRHEWNYLNPTYNFTINSIWAENQAKKQEQWRKNNENSSN